MSNHNQKINISLTAVFPKDVVSALLKKIDILCLHNNEEEYYCPSCGAELCNQCDLPDRCEYCQEKDSDCRTCSKCSINVFELEQTICIDHMDYEISNGNIRYCEDCDEFIIESSDCQYTCGVISVDPFEVIENLRYKYPEIKDSMIKWSI